jgi:hypothetical protein
MMNLSIIFDDSNRFRRFSTASTVVRLLIDIISLFPGKSAAAGDDSSMQPSCSEADPDSLSDTAVSWSCEEQTQQRCKKISQKIAICSSAGILHTFCTNYQRNFKIFSLLVTTVQLRTSLN